MDSHAAVLRGGAMAAALLVAVISPGVCAFGGTIEVQPAGPDTMDSISITTRVCVGSAPGYVEAVELSRAANVITINMKVKTDSFAVADCVSATTHVGKLSAGLYAINLTSQRRDFHTGLPYGPVTNEMQSALTVSQAIEGRVIEYSNSRDFPGSPGGHFFYSSNPDEQALLDAGSVGHFERTGASFNAGGKAAVCRFYGSVLPGPNSHFFSAAQVECDALRGHQLIPTPTDVPQWNYEGPGFSIVPAQFNADGTPGCPAEALPVYRAYNNAYTGQAKNSWDSNHRLSDSRTEIDSLVALHGWRDEGVAFCALRD